MLAGMRCFGFPVWLRQKRPEQLILRVLLKEAAVAPLNRCLNHNTPSLDPRSPLSKGLELF